MKSYTDLKQSKVLVKILPIESADMRYGYIAPYEYSDRMYDGGFDEIPYPKDFLIKNPNFSANEYDAELPCWSLAALLGVLPNGIVMNKDCENGKYHFSSAHIGTYIKADNPIDACYEMILTLHKLNLL